MSEGERVLGSLGVSETNTYSPDVTVSPERVFRESLRWGREAAPGLRSSPAGQVVTAGGDVEGREERDTHVLLKTPPRALPSRRQSCCEKKTQEIWGNELCVWQRRSSSVGPRKAMHRPKLKKTLQ